MFDLFTAVDSESNKNEIERLRIFCFTLYIMLIEKGILSDEEFGKFYNRATHVLEQEATRLQEEAIKNMSPEEKNNLDLMKKLFGNQNPLDDLNPPKKS